MRPAEFEPAVPASERPQTHALDRAVNGIRPIVL
jgi:tetrahydromethanopterin S-methyltransferase subunit F